MKRPLIIALLAIVVIGCRRLNDFVIVNLKDEPVQISISYVVDDQIELSTCSAQDFADGQFD